MENIVLFTANKRDLFKIALILVIVMGIILIASLILGGLIGESIFNTSFLMIPRFIQILSGGLLILMPLSSGPGMEVVMFLAMSFIIALIIYIIYYCFKINKYLGITVLIIASIFWAMGVFNNITQSIAAAKERAATAFYFDDKLLEQKILEGAQIEICKNAPDVSTAGRGLNLQEDCYIKFAETKRNPEYCKMIVHKTIQNNCYSYVAKIVGDESGQVFQASSKVEKANIKSAILGAIDAALSCRDKNKPVISGIGGGQVCGEISYVWPTIAACGANPSDTKWIVKNGAEDGWDFVLDCKEFTDCNGPQNVVCSRGGCRFIGTCQ